MKKQRIRHDLVVQIGLVLVKDGFAISRIDLFTLPITIA